MTAYTLVAASCQIKACVSGTTQQHRQPPGLKKLTGRKVGYEQQVALVLRGQWGCGNSSLAMRGHHRLSLGEVITPSHSDAGHQAGRHHTGVSLEFPSVTSKTLKGWDMSRFKLLREPYLCPFAHLCCTSTAPVNKVRDASLRNRGKLGH